MAENNILQLREEREISGVETAPGNVEETRSLEDSTHEPGSRVELIGDIKEAEAIEASLVELLDTQSNEHIGGKIIDVGDFQEEQEYHPEKEGGGGKASFGSNTSDPLKNYTAVKMEQGEVLQDNDWNEEEGTMQEIENAFEELERLQQAALADIKEIQESKMELGKEEKDRLEEKYGSDGPRLKKSGREGETGEEDPPPSDEETLALQMRMDRQEEKVQTLSNKSAGNADTVDKIIKNIK